MPRRKLIKYKDGVYHVNAKTNNGEWFPIPLKDCWNIYGFFLNKMSEKYKIRIHAFTLMSNHFHLLCSTPEENLNSAMNYFMTATSKGINYAAGRKNHLYGSKYYWNHASDCVGYAVLYKYVLRNPVRANLCKSIAHYPWTTLKDKKILFHLAKNELDELVPKQNVAMWVDECSEKFDEKQFQKILKKSELKDPVDEKTRRKLKIKDYI